jgi:hypothetical protein
MAIVVAAAAVGGDGTFYRPYARADLNTIYNLLFCDDPGLFRAGGANPPGALGAVLAKNTSTGELGRIAGSDENESRVRILAYNRLRASRETVAQRQLLGVVVEVPLPEGLDVLAVFGDGRMRYINHTGKLAMIENATVEMAARRERVMKSAQTVVARIGPWDKPRLPPPKLGNVRLTFLVSDGLYFGEGPQRALARDKVGGPVLAAAAELLVAITNASTAESAR